MKAFSANAGTVTRARIVRYAGAIGDFNPVHFDDEFAKGAGLPSVIAHGPLTFTMALDAVVAQAGAEGLAGFACRFKAPVFPGNEVEVSCSDSGQISVTCGGNEVLTGALTPRDP